MVRENENTQAIDYSNTIKKSNELSMAELNYGLPLNQMQLLAFAIYCTQQDGKTEFRKHEFQRKFQIEQYRTEDAYKDSEAIMDLKASVKDFEHDYFRFTNIFIEMIYDNGNFTFEWNPKMTPHILELKQKYVITDLKIASHFKSSFSWRLYEYLKACYGYWYKKFSKEELMKLFAVEDKKTYQRSTAQLKRGVLEVAIKEINQYTELEVWYTQEKIGNKITGFTLNWSTSQRETGVTDKQASLLREIHNEVERRMFDYLALKNSKSRDVARTHIIRIKEIDRQVNEKLTSKQANEFIREAKELYQYLQNLLENDGQERDTSVYFNWLE